jgi:hypothetical protein
MSRLAKSSHVVLREGAENLRKYGGPSYAADRLTILSEIARQNQREAVRLMAAVYNCLPEEADLLGEGEPVEGIRP